MTLIEGNVAARLSRKYRRGESHMPPTAAMRFRDTYERIETRGANKLAEARRRRAAAMAVRKIETVTLMADDANAKVRRVRVMDAVERAFRKGLIDDDGYRIARCIEADVLALLPPSGGLKLERLHGGGSEGGENFVLMPRAPMRAPQYRRVDALCNLRRAADALPPGPAWAVLREWAGEGASFYKLDTRWRRRKGWALAVVQLALSLLARAHVYERRKWSVDVLAEAVG